MLSSLTAPYFRNAILTSGSSLADVDFTKKCVAIEQNKNIIKYFGCTDTNTFDLIECAKQLDANTMLKKAEEYMHIQSKQIYSVPTFSPVVDNYFLVDEPANLFKQGKFKRCSILTGSNRDEGNFLLESSFPEFKNTTAPDLNYTSFKRIINDFFNFFPKYPIKSTDLVLNAILYRYTNWSDVDDFKSIRDNLDFATGDYGYACPMISLITYYAQADLNIYQYYFTHKRFIFFFIFEFFFLS